MSKRNKKTKAVKVFLSEVFALAMIGVSMVFVPLRGHLSKPVVSPEVAYLDSETPPDWLNTTENALRHVSVEQQKVGERK